MLFSEGAAYENRCGLILLRLLGYNFQYMDEQYLDKKQLDEGTGERLQRVCKFYYMRSAEALKHAEENDKISTLIRNLHANGNQKESHKANGKRNCLFQKFWKKKIRLQPGTHFCSRKNIILYGN